MTKKEFIEKFKPSVQNNTKGINKYCLKIVNTAKDFRELCKHYEMFFVTGLFSENESILTLHRGKKLHLDGVFIICESNVYELMEENETILIKLNEN